MTSLEKTVRGGIGVAISGIAVVALAPLASSVRTFGGVLVLAGWLGAAWGLHRYGRAG